MNTNNIDAQKLWIMTEKKLKGIASSLDYTIYLKKIIPLEIKDNVFYFKGDDMTKQFIEKRSKDSILEIFSDLAANINDVVVLTDKDSNLFENNSSNKEDEKKSLITKAKSLSNANLVPKYTFDTFVQGDTNRVAVAVCMRVAEYDETSNDNPLLLYGGVGLGKTHLMNAIGHRILERDPSKKILYVSSETFTNEFITAIKEKTNDEFRQKYRNVDVLMVDDVQFFSNKNSVQEELFHTFNHLYAAQKKIILTSDRAPKEIPQLEDRLRSRFVWGMMADIQPPDYATKMAILQFKAESENVDIPQEVFDYIAENVVSNIRELEGALNKVIIFGDLTSKPITLETAKEALKDILISYTTKEINVLRIKEMVADAFNVSIDELESKKRSKNIAFARQVAMYLSRNLLDMSYPSIGKEFGGKDHSTVMHATGKIEDEIEKNEIMKIKIEKIISDLNS